MPRRPAPPNQSILDAAIRCFTRDGYAATQMRTVAREAETSVGQLYVAFPSKDALFMAVAAYGNDTLVRDYLLPAATATDDPFERALAVAGAYFDFYVRERELAKLIALSDVRPGLEAGDPSAQALAAGQRAQYERMEAIAVDFGLDPSFEPTRVMRWCWAALYGLLLLNDRLPHLAVDDEELDRIIGTGMRMLELTIRESRQ